MDKYSFDLHTSCDNLSSILLDIALLSVMLKASSNDNFHCHNLKLLNERDETGTRVIPSRSISNHHLKCGVSGSIYDFVMRENHLGWAQVTQHILVSQLVPRSTCIYFDEHVPEFIRIKVNTRLSILNLFRLTYKSI